MTVTQIILKKGVEGQGIGVECVGAEEESRKLTVSAVTSGRNWEAGSVPAGETFSLWLSLPWSSASWGGSRGPCVTLNVSLPESHCVVICPNQSSEIPLFVSVFFFCPLQSIN